MAWSWLPRDQCSVLPWCVSSWVLASLPFTFTGGKGGFTLWVHWEFVLKEPISHSLKKPSGFFDNFVLNVPTICLSHSLRVLSKITHWVRLKEPTTNSQLGSISPQTLNELIGYMAEYVVATLLGNFWKNSQWVAQAHGGHIENKIVKEPTGFFQRAADGFFDGFFQNTFTTYPLIPSRSKWWVSFKTTQHLPTG